VGVGLGDQRRPDATVTLGRDRFGVQSGGIAGDRGGAIRRNVTSGAEDYRAGAVARVATS